MWCSSQWRKRFWRDQVEYSGTKHWSDIKSTLMSSNGGKVKQQFFCLLNLSIINFKGTFFSLFFPPKKPLQHKPFQHKTPPRKLKMLKKIRFFFSLWFLTPNSRQDYNCQNISQTSKNIYIYLKKSILTSTSSTRTLFFLYYYIKEQLTPLQLCIQLLLPLCLIKTFNANSSRIWAASTLPTSNRFLFYFKTFKYYFNVLKYNNISCPNLHFAGMKQKNLENSHASATKIFFCVIVKYLNFFAWSRTSQKCSSECLYTAKNSLNDN